MRVTQSMMTRNYLNSINTAMSNISGSNRRINSGKKYQRLSENVIAGSKAMRVEFDMSNNNQHISSIQSTNNELSSAESNMRSVADLMEEAQVLSIKAMNSATLSDDDREIISKQIESLQTQVLKTVNSQFGDKYLFGGTNNATAPFTIDGNGTVLFNGSDVSKIYKDSKDGKYYIPPTKFAHAAIPADPITGTPAIPEVVYDPNDPAFKTKLVADSGKRYIDIGLGIKIDSNGTVDPTTAFDASFSGLDVLGYGVDINGNPQNVISLMGDLAKKISPEPPAKYEHDKVGKANDALKKQRDFVLISITELGTRTNFLDNTESRIEDDTLNLQATKSMLVETNPAEEITQQKMFEFSWNAILKMGNSIIPPSLMDFIR